MRLVADWAPSQTEGDKLLFVFDGGVLAPQHRDKIQLATDEITTYEFHDATHIHELTIERLARRIAAGHTARKDGSTYYLEHGKRVD